MGVGRPSQASASFHSVQMMVIHTVAGCELAMGSYQHAR